jgi:hypothetical protein
MVLKRSMSQIGLRTPSTRLHLETTTNNVNSKGKQGQREIMTEDHLKAGWFEKDTWIMMDTLAGPT